MNKIKKLIAALLITTVVGVGLTVPVAQVTHAGVFGDLFGDENEEDITFVKYGGELASLSDADFNEKLTEVGNLREFIVSVVNFALGFLGLLAVLIVIYGGVLYVTAGGEDENTQKGKKSIMYAAIGLLIVLGSYAFVNTIIEAPGGEADNEGTSGTSSGSSSESSRSSDSFNAAASQVRAIAKDIYDGFEFISEVTDEFKSINNDSKKLSLYYINLPTRTEMLTYLNSVNAKLKGMESKVENFSNASSMLTEQLRKLDTAIDIISTVKGGPKYVAAPENTSYTMEVCPSGEADKCGDFEYYESGYLLLASWQITNRYFCDDERTEEEGNEIPVACRDNEPTTDPSTANAAAELSLNIYPIIEEVAVDYQKALEDNIARLEGIWDYVEVIDAIELGDALDHYAAMISNYRELAERMGEWDLDVDVNTVSEYMLEGMRQNALFYEALTEIDFVRSRLTANVIEGSAPLPVLFDTYGSTDPAGGTVQGENIVWDLAGELKVEDLYAQPKGTMVTTSTDIMTCGLFNATSGQFGSATTESVIGETAQRCTFNKPGSYQAAVLVHSNSPTEYGPGLSVLLIKVNPPTTEINLHSYVSGTSVPSAGDEEWIMHYVDNFLSTDRSSVTYTLEDAQQGIVFDAEDTEAESFRWDFGDGEVEEYSTIDKVTHKYDATGKYQMTLEVVNKLGSTDRKMFTLNVDNVSARIDATPDNNAYINTPVTFDGSASKSDVGAIKQYEWNITSNTSASWPAVTDSGTNLRSFTYEFDEAGSYKVELTVTNDAGDDSSISIDDYIVISRMPVAQLDWEIPNENQPAIVQLDASRSYDPDGTNPNLTYDWTVPCIGEECEWEVDPITDPIRPSLKFNETGDYDVTLLVTDSTTTSNPEVEQDEITAEINIDDILDIDWDEDQATTEVLDASGQAEFSFDFVSENGVAYEIDFGDGETGAGEIFGTGSATHIYTEAGKYVVRLTAYDEDDKDKSITKRIFIGGGEQPIAKIKVEVDDTDLTAFYEGTDPIELSRASIITFNAGDSVNVDGTARDLRYSWDFGDTSKSSNENATHKYDEVSPSDPGYFEVKLTVSDKDDPTLNDVDTVKIAIKNLAPKFSAIQGLPTVSDSDLVTPVTVKLEAYGVEDEDGRVTQYRWWYYDMEDPEQPLGMQVTQAANSQIIIGTNGQQGEEKTYGFGLEITDSDNLKFSTEDIYTLDTAPTITVINGLNELPEAKFKVDTTSVLTGEQVQLTSSSTDTDGNIITYIWDVEGDGFFNNEPTEFATIDHTYETANQTGYDVRLKVIDDKGGESVSEPVTIFVESLAEAPIAAFKYQVIDDTNGRGVKFINNSTADEEAGAEIISYKWDFDTDSDLSTADTDGDGILDNDVDSQASSPEKYYDVSGEYRVKLTITDNQGNTDEVTNIIKIPLANPPTAAFTFEFKDGQVVFNNNSTADTESGATIFKYIWDFDTESDLVTADSDGDGYKDNDTDSVLQNPSYEYMQSGKYKVKLTVIDTFGNEDEVINTVLVEVIGDINNPFEDDDDDETTSTVGAVLTTTPAASADGIVYIDGDSGSVKFDFSKSTGAIAYYIFDKNIYYDTDGDGIKNNDQDFKTSLPGTWKTNFDVSWGQIVARLTVQDIYGNEDTANLEIKFNQ